MNTHAASISAQLKRALAGFLAAALLSIGFAAPTWATNTVTQSVVGGSRSATALGLTFGSVTSSHGEQFATAMLTLMIDDSSGTGAGWDVKIQSSAFAYAGPLSGSSIPAPSLSIGTSASVVSTAGKAVDPLNGPLAGSAGSLDHPRTVLSASPNYGLGTYVQHIPITLRMPAQTREGTYTSTLSITIAAPAGSMVPEPRLQLERSALVFEITGEPREHQLMLARPANTEPLATTTGVRVQDDRATPTRQRSLGASSRCSSNSWLI